MSRLDALQLFLNTGFPIFIFLWILHREDKVLSELSKTLRLMMEYLENKRR